MKPLPPDSSASRRAQPPRQTRTHSTRITGVPSRLQGGQGAGGDQDDGHLEDGPLKYFPAITHMADAVTALPRELVRHFTLLKEVDAKIFAPEDTLLRQVQAALNSPLPERRHRDGLHTAGPSSVQASATGSINGSVVNGNANSIGSGPDFNEIYNPASAVWEPGNTPRRLLFRQCAYTMQEMLVSLDEKNHVISTATEALTKQLARIEHCFPFVEGEFSEEARLGSTAHWAYTENRTNKPPEKSKRETAAVNQLANAASHVGADDIAARSDARRQTNPQKKSRLNHVESDFDDPADHRNRSDKKSNGNAKKSRPADIGLGIANGAGANGGQPSKRRKTEKPAGGAIMERSLSAIHGAPGAISKGKNASPRETPLPDPKKRSKILPPTNGQARKKTAATISNIMTPATNAVPLHGTFADTKLGAGASPAPGNNGRPAAARARQNSTQSLTDAARNRPASSASNKQQNVHGIGLPDLNSVSNLTGRSVSEVKAKMKESADSARGEHMIQDADQVDSEMRGALLISTRKDSGLKREDSEANGDLGNAPVTLTKSGRASKPSTPAMAQFPEPVRSRSGRGAFEQTGANKRSHKKGAGQQAQLLAAQAAEEDTTGSIVDEDEDDIPDADEPTYCYCNGVSYGEMVGCDSDNCTREWFHLECVGLKVAPKGNAKWYCDDCKERMKNAKRFAGGR